MVPARSAAPGPPASPTNVLAVVALATSFFLPIAGIVCGHIALAQIRRTGEEGRGLALAGLIIGYCLTGLIALFVVLYVGFAVVMVAMFTVFAALAGAAR